MSSDFEERLKTHNFGQVRSTNAFKPWELFHLEKFETRIDARTREKYLKSAAGRRWRNHN
ncbi:GIY-YIG nuclease family protein [Gelidibacter sediminis]|uniref:GIY-YIG nuclease family protein n=1 Tax=Gelidibacter sediminis TaxID=1608710 RepID=UPI00105D0299|nr:GIY-YIG nuclease family protein [Gelidibacter sediminis]